jgi:hypothetical protein
MTTENKRPRFSPSVIFASLWFYCCSSFSQRCPILRLLSRRAGFISVDAWFLTASLLFVLNAGAQTLNLPPRPAGAPTGSQFISIITPMSLTDRENAIFSEVLSGNVPDFLRTLVPISVSATINSTLHTGTYYVTPDYVVIGTDADYFLEPMTPLLGQRICDALGCTMPTRKMVNQIWTNAAVKMNPQFISPSPAMITVPVFADHNTMVRTQRVAFTNALGAMVSGDKKDVIISSRIYTNFATPSITKVVVIYGWHYPSGDPVQPLYNGHEETYADYSHGIRLVQNAMTLDGNSNTVTSVVMQSALAALLSDDGPGEGTGTNGVINIPRYGFSPPVILTQPRSQTVLSGATVTFRSFATNPQTLYYQWQFSGASIAGATGTNLVIASVQGSNSGLYTVLVSNALGSANSRAAFLRVNTNPHPVLFADTFETDTSSSWNQFWGASNSIPDYTAQWAFNYGTRTYTFNGVTNIIPPAPNSRDGSTRGVRFTVNNNDGVASIAGVNIYPKGQSFSNDFALKFDMWINYPGGAGGTGTGVAGSTEHAIAGINHFGTQVNWAALTGASSDGIWFAVDGEGGGASRDYRAYVGNPVGPPTELMGAASGLSQSDNTAAIYQTLFPSSRFETAGAPGKNWVEFELRQTNHMVLWLLDGTVVAQPTNASSFNAGTVMLGFMDTFASIAAPAQDAFVLFDNVRVEDLSDRVRFLSAVLNTNSQMQMIFSAVPGRNYTLEASTNLVDWETILSGTASNAPVQFVDTQAPNFTQRFYRTRTL